MNTRLIVSLLVAGALAFACGPRPNSDMPSVAFATPVQRVPARSALVSNPRARDDSSQMNSKLNLAVSKHALRMALVVTNTGKHFAEVRFPTGQAYDFVVVDSVGREVWRWSRGHLFTQGVQNKQIGAGETMRVMETMTDTLKPGRYTAIAVLKSENYPLQERVDFVMQ
jgi:hypothetical protein